MDWQHFHSCVVAAVLALHLRNHPWRKTVRTQCVHKDPAYTEPSEAYGNEEKCGSSAESYKPGKIWVVWTKGCDCPDYRCDGAVPLPNARLRS
jgi:hypothetical protein